MCAQPIWSLFMQAVAVCYHKPCVYGSVGHGCVNVFHRDVRKSVSSMSVFLCLCSNLFFVLFIACLVTQWGPPIGTLVAFDIKR